MKERLNPPLIIGVIILSFTAFYVRQLVTQLRLISDIPSTDSFVPIGAYIAVFIALVFIYFGAIGPLFRLPSIALYKAYNKRPYDYYHNNTQFDIYNHRREALSYAIYPKPPEDGATSS